MKPGMISRDLLALLQKLSREVPDDQQDAFFKHCTDYLGPIIQPDVADISWAKQYALARIEMPEWLVKANAKKAAKAGQAKRDAEQRKRYEVDYRRRELDTLVPAYGREHTRELQRKYSKRRREYDDA
jgi:hypothetical protein